MTSILDAIFTLAPYAVAGVGALWAHRSAIATGARTGQQVAAAALAHAEPLRLRREARIVVLRAAQVGCAPTESPLAAYLTAADGWALVVTHTAPDNGNLSPAAIADLAAADAVCLDRLAVPTVRALCSQVTAEIVVAFTAFEGGRPVQYDLPPWAERLTGATTRPQAAHWLLAGLMRREQVRLSRLLIPVPVAADGAPALPVPVTPGALAAAPVPVITPAAYERVRELTASFAVPRLTPVTRVVTVL